MDTTTQIQIVNEIVYISHGAYIFEEGVNPTILPLVMGK